MYIRTWRAESSQAVIGSSFLSGNVEPLLLMQQPASLQELAVPGPVTQKVQFYQPARRTYSCPLVRKLATLLTFL